MYATVHNLVVVASCFGENNTLKIFLYTYSGRKYIVCM